MPDTSRRELVQYLDALRAAGVEQLPRAPAVPRVATEALAPQMPSVDVQHDESKPTAGVAPNVAGNLLEDSEMSDAASLEILREEVAACTRCEELAATRTQTVFGTGDPAARLCLLGEAPGADEDRQGEPFVGRSGQLLNKILAACNLQREEVYILNILKCRPPGNRNPTADESCNCRRFLNRQLQLIDPEFICCLGAVAAQNLLDTSTPIGRLRGTLHDYRGIKVLCTYHPAYLLRNPPAKKDAWEDMKLLMRSMGTPVD
ncbi:uracil-DNA glycosylase [Pirellulales bacterium]|nr:uracil-DNA glycosylase [Pirellulales bacterium]